MKRGGAYSRNTKMYLPKSSSSWPWKGRTEPDLTDKIVAEALDLLRAEHERGHLHSAWFKDVMLNRFYAICNCCKCC
jgi:hypothetical protein